MKFWSHILETLSVNDPFFTLVFKVKCVMS